MFNCYRRCKTTRDLVDFCSGYYPDIARWVRLKRAEGVSAEKVRSKLYAIKAEIIRKHEVEDMPEKELIAQIASH
jgi:hypothetical protein